MVTLVLEGLCHGPLPSGWLHAAGREATVQLWGLFLERALTGVEGEEWGDELALACRLAQSAGVSGVATTLAAEGGAPVLVAEAAGLVAGWE